jgi:hypothetical protein
MRSHVDFAACGRPSRLHEQLTALSLIQHSIDNVYTATLCTPSRCAFTTKPATNLPYLQSDLTMDNRVVFNGYNAMIINKRILTFPRIRRVPRARNRVLLFKKWPRPVVHLLPFFSSRVRMGRVHSQSCPQLSTVYGPTITLASVVDGARGGCPLCILSYLVNTVLYTDNMESDTVRIISCLHSWSNKIELYTTLGKLFWFCKPFPIEVLF